MKQGQPIQPKSNRPPFSPDPAIKHQFTFETIDFFNDLDYQCTGFTHRFEIAVFFEECSSYRLKTPKIHDFVLKSSRHADGIKSVRLAHLVPVS